MKHIKIRELRKYDIDNGFSEVLKIISPHMATSSSVYNMIRQLNTFVYVVEEYFPDRIVGTATLILNYKFGGHLGLIEDVAILPECEGLYYGTHLIKRILREAKEMGCYKVILLCKDNNVEFYEKIGMDKYQNCMCKKF